jgi:prepilin-type N-terminal cleavage/methylation domain-containing protein
MKIPLRPTTSCTRGYRSSIKGTKGFTLIELLVTLAVVVIIIAIAVPALNTAKSDATLNAQNATAKTLNEGVIRAILAGNNGIASMDDWTNTYGNNPSAGIVFLINNGYVLIK